MKVSVVGLWHLGTVTAVCLAAVGHEVTGVEFDRDTIAGLREGRAPLHEPGLEELLRLQLNEGRLNFTADVAAGLAAARVVWITYDTPVDEDDRADVAFVVDRIARIFPHLPEGCLVLISSQVLAGTTRCLEVAYAKAHPQQPVGFAYSPENLRLGKGIETFLQPKRIVAGIRTEVDRETLRELLEPLTKNIVWMSVESAEMTKHALNAFLATSISFANEIACLCEQTGADAKEVERGLKTDERIGEKAYLAPGGAFAGGTLARDIAFLTELGLAVQRPTHLLSAVRRSNAEHRNWPRAQLERHVGTLRGKKVAVWGLTYKPGTDTLRRSPAIELCAWLLEQGSSVQAHDPVVKVLPPDLVNSVNLCSSAISALDGADALVVCTEWPEYRSVGVDDIVAAMNTTTIIDVNGFLKAAWRDDDVQIRYFAVGKASR